MRLPLAVLVGLASVLSACRPSEAPASATPATPAAATPVAPVVFADTVRVYKTPTCGCCAAWVTHLREAGFAVAVVDTADLAPLKAQFGVPSGLGSCHTARVGGYTVEGHVPAADVARLLRERPADVAGIAVPGMPLGSPGMEVPGQPAQPYDVVAFGPKGQGVFASHR